MNDRLRKGPELPSTYSRDVLFTESARQAWQCAIQSLQIAKRKDICILVPAYIGQTDREGSGIFDPIRNTDVRFKFYNVNEQLTPDVDELKQHLNSQAIDVLLVVHYFGFQLADMSAIQQLCQANSVCLVEDCAHVCFDLRDGLGSFGDFSFYSLHKFFPTGTGGALRINNSQFTEIANDQANSTECSAKVLGQVLRTDLDRVHRHRIECFHHLAHAIEKLTGLNAMYGIEHLTSDVTPHNFPVLVANDQREPLYFALKESGFVTIALYYQMVDELSKQEFPLSFTIANSILNLPVHQDTSLQQLDALIQRIEKYFG